MKTAEELGEAHARELFEAFQKMMEADSHENPALAGPQDFMPHVLAILTLFTAEIFAALHRCCNGEEPDKTQNTYRVLDIFS